MVPPPAPPTEVVLRDYPLRLGARQAEHLDEVMREFQLLALADPSVTRDVPGRLLEIVDLLTSRFGGDIEEPLRLREEALARGESVLDVRYPVRPEARELVLGWRRVMAEVDDFCRSGDLLALARPADVVALQEWSVAEYLAQLDGEAPTPWTGPLD